MATLAWAGHALASLVLTISFRGCADECHAYGLGAVVLTVGAGIPFGLCGGVAFVRWWRNGRLVEDLLALRWFLLVVGAALVPFAAAGGLGVLEEVIETVGGRSLQPESWEVLGRRPVTWITLPELAGAAYVAATAAVLLMAGAALIAAARRLRPVLELA